MRKKIRYAQRATFRDVWRTMELRFKIGLFILLFFVIVGLILPRFNPLDTSQMSTFRKNLPVSSKHLLGTNALGQDIFWQAVDAVQNSLIIGIVVAACSTAIGVLVGLFAGFSGGLIDRVLTFIGDAIIVIPSLPILILISSMMSGRTSIMTIAAVLTVFNWPWPARQARAMALTIREREFINTAHFSGENRLKIIVCEILPYVASWAMSNFIKTIMVAIGTESSLAILGLSSTTTATLGNMIYWARQYQAILQERWIWIGIPVGLTMLLFIGLFMTFTGYSDYTSRKRGR